VRYRRPYYLFTTATNDTVADDTVLATADTALSDTADTASLYDPTILPHTTCSGSAPLVNGSTQRLMSAQTGVEVQQYEGVHLEPVQEDLNEHEASSVETAKKV